MHNVTKNIVIPLIFGPLINLNKIIFDFANHYADCVLIHACTKNRGVDLNRVTYLCMTIVSTNIVQPAKHHAA